MCLQYQDFVLPIHLPDQQKNIMKEIHKTCLKYGTKPGGFVNYMDGANIGGFVKVADTMIDQGAV